uniref:HGGxSTG domain-containing protein n=1 Tax=Bradyrhizobium sp. (strain ORS 278) TaxID=114615 RepID=UPI002738DC3A|nr:HGGxSTG domain-containing protein [Bradyrhizobium sp. ORS 278]
MQRAKRCGAKTRGGKPCLSPAMANGRCRMHGGPSPGAPKGNQYALKHGRFAARTIQLRREISALVKSARAACKAVK